MAEITSIREINVNKEIVKIESRTLKKDEIVPDTVKISVEKSSLEDFKSIINSVVIEHKY